MKKVDLGNLLSWEFMRVPSTQENRALVRGFLNINKRPYFMEGRVGILGGFLPLNSHDTLIDVVVSNSFCGFSPR